MSGGHELTRGEVERYCRQMVLPDVGLPGQRKLRSSSAVVVGAGGLGVPALVYLAAAGVGRIGIVDGDLVEASNLNRQTIYSEGDLGKQKAEVAAERLSQLNPHVEIVPYRTDLDSSNALGILGEYGIVLDCTDNLPSRYLISDACVLLRKPDVYGSVFRFDGQATVFAENGPCYRCLFPEPPPPDSVQDCATAGVLGVLPGVMGSIQATQAINLVIGKGEPLVGRLLIFDAARMSFDEIRIGKNPACSACGAHPTLTGLIDYEEFCGIARRARFAAEVDPTALKRLVEGGSKLQLLDVREPYEHDLCHLPGSKLIPLGELQRRVRELDPSAETIVYCHVGERSATAAAFLVSRGFTKVKNLKGGIRAWAETVDSDMPLY